MVNQVVAACKGKSTEELIAAGLPKLASMGELEDGCFSCQRPPWRTCAGGGGAAAPAAAAAGGAAPAAAAEAAPKKEEKKEESEEEDDDMGFGLFD